MVDRPRLVTWLLAILVVLATAILIVAPAALAWRLRTAIAQALPGPEAVKVDVRVSPWYVISGRLDQVNIEARRTVVGQLPVDQLSLRLRDVRLDASRLVFETALAISHVGDGEGVVILRQEDLERFLADAKGVSRPVVRLGGGLVTIEGDVRLATFELHARLEGGLAVASPTTVNLHVQALTVSGVEIPREIGAALISGFNPLITLEGFPLPVRIESVDVNAGQVRLMLRVGDRS